LQASFIIVPNDELRKKITDIQTTQGFFALNTFGILAMEAAYLHGEKWLEEANSYIRSNIDYIKTNITESLPTLKAIDPEGTYLVWIDCRETGLSDEDLRKKVIAGGLAVNFGHTYGEGGEGFIRLNVACPRSIVEEGFTRLKNAFK